MDAPYLETFKFRLDRALSNFIWLKMPLLIAEGLDDIEKVLCNSHHSMMLFCRKRHIPVGSYVISGNIVYLKPGVVRRQQ